MMRNEKMLRTIVVVAFLFVSVLPLCVGAEPPGKLVMFHAGSLAAPFEALEKTFEAKYPRVDLLREASGSSKAAHGNTFLYQHG